MTNQNQGKRRVGSVILTERPAAWRYRFPPALCCPILIKPVGLLAKMKSSSSATLRGFLVFCTVLPLLGAGAGDPPHTSESSVKHVEAKQGYESSTGKEGCVMSV